MNFKTRLLAATLTSLLTAGCGTDSESEDTTAPVITILGNDTISLTVDDTYTEQGATVTDNVDTGLSAVITGTVDTSTAGTYTITYTAVDAAGNQTTATRTVIVAESGADTTAPVISLVGEATISLIVGDTYTEQGATVTDNVDTDLTATPSGNVDTATEGTYTVTYTATDAAGNQGTATRTVFVSAPGVDTISPVITLVGESTISLTVGDTYAEQGATVTDNVDSDLNAVITGEVDTSTAGSYTITYTATDTAGNQGTATRTVIVSEPSADTQAPVITLVGSATINLALDGTYSEPGATVTDNVDADLVADISGTVDTSTVGTYTITYTATDAAGNQATTTRMVYVYEPGALPQTPFIPTADLSTRAPVEDPTPDAAGYMSYGAGNVSTSFNPDGYGCVFDHGNWVFSAGVTLPGIAGCNDGVAVGTPTPIHPQVTGPAADKPLAAHRWWGSVSFLGEMQIGDPNSAAYITADPISARISNKGVRVLNLPSGFRVINDKEFGYTIPDPFAEVFDGIALANSDHDNLEAYLKDSNDASVTVEWQASGQAVMEATFVHGSPYIYFKSYQGQPLFRSFQSDGFEKGTFYQDSNTLGVWTAVAGGRQDFLIVGEGDTQFSNIETAEIGVTNTSNELTLVVLPNNLGGEPTADAISTFKSLARNVIAQATVDYSVDPATHKVTVTHNYLDASGQQVETLAGLHPLHWKHLDSADQSDITAYNVRSARGTIKFSETDSFSYELPYVGVLPTMPSALGDYDLPTLEGLVNDFISLGQTQWNFASNHCGGVCTDTYWAGKNYGKVAEVAAIARSIGMNDEADLLINFLKTELEDWFTADTSGQLDEEKYFVYDEEWDTLLGVDESFGSHQLLNDHHFHYGYFIRAAAEICRVDKSWCDTDQYGGMVELLIRDYAAGRDDSLFPYMRHFDPANGFSWASGKVNFARGNNNESTSEAANAYGAIVLYGLITGQQDLVDRGVYLHASTSSTYWQYWNNIDGYNNVSAEADNFPDGYDRITTSIIWGDGAVYSTWFSPAPAHILGIQGLPINPLTLHVGQYPDYLVDYIDLGLTDSSNGKPSGLPEDNWRDIWWNILATNDADAAITDYNSMASYTPEQGETRAHTYHWLHTWKNLGQPASGMPGSITADDPAAMVFNKDGVTTYVAYNFSGQPKTVTFSDETELTAAPYSFATKVGTSSNDDVTAPTAPTGLALQNIAKVTADVSWSGSSDDVQVAGYMIHLSKAGEVVSVQANKSTNLQLTGLEPSTTYLIAVVAYDAENNQSEIASASFTTLDANASLPPVLSGMISVSGVTQSKADLSWPAASDDEGVAGYEVTVTDGAGYDYQETVTETMVSLTGLSPEVTYQVSVVALDGSSLQSSALTFEFTSMAEVGDLTFFTDALAAGYTLDTWASSGGNDVKVQNGVIDGQFAADGNFYLVAPNSLDLSGYAGGSLHFDVKLISLGSHSEILVKMDSGWPNLSDVNLSSYGGLPTEGGDFKSYSIPVADFIASSNSLADGQMNIGAITQPIVFDGFGGAGMHIQVDNIRLTAE